MDKVLQEKAQFVNDFWNAIKPYFPEIANMHYSVTPSHREVVSILYTGGGQENINVTIDSLSAMLRDISARL